MRHALQLLVTLLVAVALLLPLRAASAERGVMSAAAAYATGWEMHALTLHADVLPLPEAEPGIMMTTGLNPTY